MVKLGYDLKELYDYSLKEILFILKYRREGLAYEIWRHGTMSRAAQAKEFPMSPEKATPELFERQQGVRVQDLPPEMQKAYAKALQTIVNNNFTAG